MRLRDRLPMSVGGVVRRRLGRAVRVDGGYRRVSPSRFEGLPPDGETVVHTWSLFQGTLFAEIDLEPAVRAVAFIGDGRAVEVRVRGRGHVSFVAPAPSGLPIDLAVRRKRQWRRLGDPGALLASGESYHRVFQRFVGMLHELPGGRVLEVGARVVTGASHREVTPSRLDYVGLDIEPGPGVDVVGDAHSLDWPDESFDAVCSFAVLEHLLMPWKVALEFNRVLKPGGLVFCSTHQTYPVHEEPWDFWRVSSHAWPALFNPRTGFEILDRGMGEPAAVVPLGASAGSRRVAYPEGGMGRLGSSVLARKVSTSDLSWDVSTSDVTSTRYPSATQQ